MKCAGIAIAGLVALPGAKKAQQKTREAAPARRQAEGEAMKAKRLQFVQGRQAKGQARRMPRRLGDWTAAEVSARCRREGEPRECKPWFTRPGRTGLQRIRAGGGRRLASS